MRLDRFVHFVYFVFYDSCWLCKVYIGLCFRYHVFCLILCVVRCPVIVECLRPLSHVVSSRFFLSCHVYTYNTSCLSIANSCFGPRPDNGAACIGSPAPQDQAWPAKLFSRESSVDGRPNQGIYAQRREELRQLKTGEAKVVQYHASEEVYLVRAVGEKGTEKRKRVTPGHEKTNDATQTCLPAVVFSITTESAHEQAHERRDLKNSRASCRCMS